MIVSYLVVSLFTIHHLLTHSQEATEEASVKVKLSDRFNLVLQVARKVQNKLGQLANSTEKIKKFGLPSHHVVTLPLFLVFSLGNSRPLRNV